MEKTKKASIKAAGQKILLPHLVSVSSFAKRTGQKRQSIWYQINVSKNIIPVYVGMDKDMYIDWNEYKNFDFREYPREK